MRRWSLWLQAGLLIGVIVLPQPNRAEHYERSVSRGDLIENAFIVANAAERRAECWGGFYAPAGASLVGFFPRQQPLPNPLTLVRSEPVDGAAAAPGQIGYTPISMQGHDVGYVITVFGRDSTVGPRGDGILFTLQKVTDPPPLALR